jgi:hypothetical protein
MQFLQDDDCDKNAKSFMTTHGKPRKVKVKLEADEGVISHKMCYPTSVSCISIKSPGKYRLKIRYAYTIFANNKVIRELKTIHTDEEILSQGEHILIRHEYPKESSDEINEDEVDLEFIPLKYEIIELEYIGRKKYIKHN